MMKVVENKTYTRRSALNARVWRAFQSAGARALAALKSAWLQAFPFSPLPSGPDTPPTVAKAAALREAALLEEQVDAVSEKKVG
jgi:hypothetical protein